MERRPKQGVVGMGRRGTSDGGEPRRRPKQGMVGMGRTEMVGWVVDRRRVSQGVGPHRTTTIRQQRRVSQCSGLHMSYAWAEERSQKGWRAACKSSGC